MKLNGWPVGLALLSATILAGSGCSCDGPRTQGQASKLGHSLAKDPTGEADFLIEFGVVPLGERKTERVTVTNEGNTALVLSSPVMGEGAFSVDLPGQELTLGVGASGSLSFSFEPVEANDAAIETIATLFSNEGRGLEYTVRLVGQGVLPTLRCDPAEIEFGAIPRGRQISARTLCSNPLPIPIEASVGRIKGNQASSFTASLEGAIEGRVTIPAHGSVALDVILQAQFLGRSEVAIELSDPFRQRIASIPVRAEAVEGAVVVEPGTCLDFSYVQIGAASRQSLQVRGVGGRALRINRIEVPESSEAHFSITTETPIELALGGASTAIEVEFHPASSGLHQTQIVLHVEDSEEGASLVTGCALGFGGGPAISCVPSAIDFGQAAIGTTSRRNLTCMNSGVEIDGVLIDPLVIDQLRSTAPEFSAAILEPRLQGYRIGESFQVEVRYAPTEERFDTGSILLETRSAPGGAYEVAVSGQGRDLPPCDFELVPPTLHFGVVDRGSELTRSFRITNLLGTACLLGDLRLGPDSDPAYTLEPIANFELEGHQSLRVPVTFAPSAYASPILGTVEFQISDPARQDQRVELRGSSARPCLAVEPAQIDFGKVGPGCISREARISVSNICSQPLELLSLESADGADSELFQVRSRPLLSRILNQGEREEMTVVYAPLEVGSHLGAIEVGVEGSESYFSELLGEAVPNPIQTDTFDQKSRPKVDILWVMDNSASFELYQEQVATNLPSFLTTAKANNVDFHIAVTTSGLDPRYGSSCPGGAEGGEDGRFFPIDGSHPRILTGSTLEIERHWAHNMRVGDCHATETYLEAAYRALSRPLINEAKDSRYRTPWNDGNAGFLRPDASLSIIFVADEPDQSTSYGKTVTDYLNFFKGLKGYNMLRVHGIVGSKYLGVSSCGNKTGDRIHHLIEETGGTWVDICTPAGDREAWSAGLTRMSEGAFGFLSRFILRGIPGDSNGDGRVDEDDIELALDGRPQAPVSPSRQQRWTYDPVDNAIDFTPLFVPKGGTQLTATYQVACFAP